MPGALDAWGIFVTGCFEASAVPARVPGVRCSVGSAIHTLKAPHLPNASPPSSTLPRPRRCRYGVTHSLDQVFESPALVKHFLQEESRLTEAFIGNSQAQARKGHVG